MATVFKDSKGVEIGKRCNAYSIDPRQVVIYPELNGRHELPEIETLIADILSKPDGLSIKGQTTPVIIRRDGTRPVLVAGHRRLRAILEINKRKLTPEPLAILCSYMQLTEVEALAVAVTENRERVDITPIDEAFCIKQFLRLGKDHEWIAMNGGFFPTLAKQVFDEKVGIEKIHPEMKKAIAWVKKLEKLLGLTEEAQDAVSKGKIKVSAAEHLSTLEAEKQRALVKEGKTTSKDIQKATGKPEKMSLHDVKQTLDDRISDGDIDGQKIPKFVLDFLCELRDKI